MKILNTLKTMDKKQLLKVSLFVLIVIILLILVFSKIHKNKVIKLSEKQTQSTSQEIKPVEFTQDQLTEYYKTYEDPYVKHIRTALNSYLDGTMKGINPIGKVVKSGTNANGKLEGLDSFSKDYYKSKFVVLMAQPSVAGGKEINIIFQDKPDKIFWTWVYAIQPNVYVLRGFAENTAITGQKLQNLLILYKNIISDKVHVL